MSYRIFQAWTTQPQGCHNVVFSSATGKALGSLLLLCCGAFGAAADAYAGISLRISLATTGVPSVAAPFVAPDAPLDVAPEKRPTPAEQVAAAKAELAAKTQKQAELRAKVKSLVKLYAAKSDLELTSLSAQWQELPSLDRQVLLREVKMRMARQRGRKGSVQIRTERRFGRLLRQADGSVVRVETRVVQVRPAKPGEQTRPVRVRKSKYGTGFERRSAETQPAADARP